MSTHNEIYAKQLVSREQINKSQPYIQLQSNGLDEAKKYKEG